jgi:site-specific recombinase XerD
MSKDLLDAYRAFLSGLELSASTIDSHSRWAARFLDHLSNSGVRVSETEIKHVDAFLALWMPTLGRATRNAPVSVLRRLLGFLYEQKITTINMSGQVIGPRIYHAGSLPKGLSREQVKRVIAQVDRQGEHGHRDYAILLLLAFYGVRVSKVTSLLLSSIDWEHDTIRFIRPKIQDHLDLPLLPEVGNAILEYLQWERPAVGDDALFFYPQKQKTIPIIRRVKRYMKAAGIEVTGPVTAMFRHGLAMELLAQNVPLKTIADTLGHRHLISTCVYAKTEVDRLREAALPLPASDGPPLRRGTLHNQVDGEVGRLQAPRCPTANRAEGFISDLAPEFENYLVLKRATGRIYDHEESMLLRLDRFLAERDACLTVDCFHEWMRTLRYLHSATQSHYYHQARQFCEYRRRADPTAFVPDRRFDPLEEPARVPAVLSTEDVARLFGGLDATRAGPCTPLWRENYRMIAALLYCCGLRVGEAIRLDMGDVDMTRDLLTIRNTKFFKTRLVPMHSSVGELMSAFMQKRAAAGLAADPDVPVFCSSKGGRYFRNSVKDAIKRRLIGAGLRTVARRVRVHDLRHTFAVHRLTKWYWNGDDVQAKLPILSQYLGHVDIAYTQNYLRLVPDLCAAAMQRFQQHAVTLRRPSHEQ